MIALLASALLFPANASQPAPAAFVLAVKATVTLQRGKDKPVRVGLADLLIPGDRLTPGKDGELTLVFLHDGHRERLKERTAVTVEDKGCSPARAVAVLPAARLSSVPLTNLRLHAQNINATGGRAAVGVLRSESGQSPRVTPMQGARVLSDHPLFSWPAVEKADGYRIQLLNGLEGRDERILWEAAARAPRLFYPEDEPVLERSLKYRCRRVIALLGEETKQVLESKFFVLSQKQSVEVARLRLLAEGTDPADWLLAAAAYEAAGVYDKALPLYEKLARHWPADRNLQVVLAQYYERAGRKDEAGKARARAKKLEAKSSGE